MFHAKMFATEIVAVQRIGRDEDAVDEVVPGRDVNRHVVVPRREQRLHDGIDRQRLGEDRFVSRSFGELLELHGSLEGGASRPTTIPSMRMSAEPIDSLRRREAGASPARVGKNERGKLVRHDVARARG